MRTKHGFKLGWQKDLTDVRDYTLDTEHVSMMMAQIIPVSSASNITPATADLRQWCSVIDDQSTLGSCTAHAGTGLVEYFERKTFGKYIDVSRLFLYSITRKLIHETGDSGAQLRNVMQALVTVGVPPEEYWPYVISKFDAEPPTFCYSLAANYKTLKYFRFDPAGTSPATVLASLRTSLANGVPMMFGTTVYSSFPGLGDGKGEVPFPAKNDKVEGGHAMMIVGYDDNKQIGAYKGALMIRNSWGTGWGMQGYGWLPYQYVLTGIASDFWSIMQEGWIDTGVFA